MTEQREVMDVDVLFVGGGVASLSGALHLSNLIKEHNKNSMNATIQSLSKEQVFYSESHFGNMNVIKAG